MYGDRQSIQMIILFLEALRYMPPQAVCLIPTTRIIQEPWLTTLHMVPTENARTAAITKSP